ncbi:MAG TPA: SMC-Scp complex subunit ScpB [Candidatus Paceibacterota bacterium]
MEPEGRPALSDLAARAEAFLFAEGGSLALHSLAKLLKCDEESARAALEELSVSLRGSGLTLILAGKEVALATAERVSSAVRESLQETLERDIGDAGLEVLAIVLYRGPSTRAQIDYIRGVNTTSTIRTLLSRGLLDRANNPDDAREYLYRPTAELLAHLGVSASSALPDYDTIRAELAAFETARPAFEDHGDTENVGNA